jgi:hypothetical protein
MDDTQIETDGDVVDDVSGDNGEDKSVMETVRARQSM